MQEIESWEDFVKAGKPVIENENTLKAAELIGKIYEGSIVGGNVHIITDDKNVEDHWVACCLIDAYENTNEQDSSSNHAEIEYLKLIFDMSIQERCSTIVLAEPELIRLARL